MKRKALFGNLLMLIFVFPFLFCPQMGEAQGGVVYIRADGSIEPSSAPIQRNGDVYTFTGNIDDSIVIERGNITLNGNRYSLQGSGEGTGIQIDNVNNVLIQNVDISNFRTAIEVNNSSYSTISENAIDDCGFFMASVVLEGPPFVSRNNTYVGNVFTSNAGYGFLLWGLYGTVSGNTIVNQKGVAIQIEGYSNTIVGNAITNSTLGIRLPGSSNRVYQNNFIDNTNQSESEGSNEWDDGSDGNYWSDYDGADPDGDGVGNTPYVINEENQDNYPLMAPVEVTVIPEYSSWLLPSLLLIAALLIVIYKKPFH